MIDLSLNMPAYNVKSQYNMNPVTIKLFTRKLQEKFTNNYNEMPY